MRVPFIERPPDITRKQMYRMFAHTKYPPTSFAANQHNEIEAIKARVLKATPVVDEQEMNLFVAWVKDNYRKLFPNLRKSRPVDIDIYLKNSNASPNVKRIIRDAHKALRDAGYSHYSNLTRNELYKFTKRKAFVKVENALYDSPLGRLHKAPRLIQGASPEFVALVGPMFMAIQAQIKKSWSSQNSVWFSSGANARNLADYITAPAGMSWFENDVSAYDASIGVELCELELFLAKKMGATPVVLQLMKANISTHGVTSTGVKYSCKGTRKSGDPYTSCFNSVLNGLMHLYAVCKTGVPIHDLQKHVRMLVQGDDNLMRHSPSIKPDWGVLLRLGFKCENIYRSGPEKAEFCSSRLYPVDDGYCFGPKLGRLLNKVLVFNNPPLNVAPESLARGVAIGLLQVATYVPLVQVFCERLLALTVGFAAHFLHIGEWQMKHSPQRMCVDTTRFTDDTYGLQKQLTRYATEHINGLEFGDCIDSPTLNMLFDKDTSAQQCIFVHG